MENKLVFRKGFIVEGVRFGWSNKQLYQLPYHVDGRSYGLRIVRMKMMKSTPQDWAYYHIRRQKIGFDRVLEMTEPIDWEVNL